MGDNVDNKLKIGDSFLSQPKSNDKLMTTMEG